MRAVPTGPKGTPQRPRRSASAWLALPMLLAASPLAAQTVRGTLTDQATGAPINGAMSLLVTETGAVVASTLTNEQGGFVLRAPGGGRYRVRAERIGYRNQTGPVLSLAAGEERHFPMAVLAEAVQLEGITARGDRRCRVRPREGLATAQAWEEARKALAKAAWVQRQNVLRYAVDLYHRTVDATDLRVLEETVERKPGYAEQPFVSIPVDQLIARGFVQTSDGGSFYDYYAPDAEVLLSDAFLDTHCFRLVGGEGARSGQVGLAFEPVRGRDVPEIQGTFWLEERSALLQELEYRYVNLPWQIPGDQVGGRVEFAPLPSGALIVRRWRIRMPRLAVREQTWRGTRRRELRVDEYRDRGGEVTWVRTPDGALLALNGWQAEGDEPAEPPAPDSTRGDRQAVTPRPEAEELPDSARYALEEVVVEAVSADTRVERELKARGTRAHHLSRADIERVLPRTRTLAQLLASMPGTGLTVRDDVEFRNGLSTQRGLCLQAGRNRSGADRCRMVEVYLDGVRLTHPEFQLLGVEPGRVEEIEFLSSLEAGSRYGTGAANGVLRIRTRGGRN